MDTLLSLNFFGVDDPKDLPEPEPLGKLNVVARTAFDQAAGLDALAKGPKATAEFARRFAPARVVVDGKFLDLLEKSADELVTDDDEKGWLKNLFAKARKS
jgi:hypothetical protein